MSVNNFETMIVQGFEIDINHSLGHMAIYHDGTISWDQLWAIKNDIWGDEVAAFEVFPKKSRLVNSLNCRHLWLLGEGDFCPDLLGEECVLDTLAARYKTAWATPDGGQL